MEDSAFIVWLRNLNHARGRLGDPPADLQAQMAWMDKYLERDGDWYFLVESQRGIRLGTVSLYDRTGGSAEMGRYIIRPSVPAAVPSLLAVNDLGFDALQLTELRATTVATNILVLRLVNQFGYEPVRSEPAGRIIGGQPVEIVHSLLSRSTWTQRREQLVAQAQAAERLMARWDDANCKIEPA
jgi:RimJ/RimL family protein N-acetyltransferase